MYWAKALVICREVRRQSLESPASSPCAPVKLAGQANTPKIAPGIAFDPPVVWIIRNCLGAFPDKSAMVAVTSSFVPPLPNPSAPRRNRLPWFTRVNRPLSNHALPLGASAPDETACAGPIYLRIRSRRFEVISSCIVRLNCSSSSPWRPTRTMSSSNSKVWTKMVCGAEAGSSFKGITSLTLTDAHEQSAKQTLTNVAGDRKASFIIDTDRAPRVVAKGGPSRRPEGAWENIYRILRREERTSSTRWLKRNPSHASGVKLCGNRSRALAEQWSLARMSPYCA